MKTKVGSLSALVALMTGLIAWSPAAAKAQLVDTVLPLQIDNVVLENGQLVALGSLGGNPFKTPISLATVEDENGENGPVCPILDLRLAPIHLDLLGLRVDTSNIHLLIAAEPGPGMLLGNLLCAVAGLLDAGLSLEDILALLPLEDRIALLEGIRDLLNEVLDTITAPQNIAGLSGQQGPGKGQGKGQGKGKGSGGGRDTAPGQVKQGGGQDCDILNLRLAPIDLRLLGLIVHLDNCSNGPVTVDITARPGQGRLLGNLLCGLAGLLDDGLDLDDLDVQELINAIAAEVLRLLDLP
jgi:hypothetical protein